MAASCEANVGVAPTFGNTDGESPAPMASANTAEWSSDRSIQFADKDAAFRATSALRRDINLANVRCKGKPITLSQLADHYCQRELAPSNRWKTHSTKMGYRGYLRKWIIPRWGGYTLNSIRAGEIELWLRSLPLARSTCAKIRNVMSVLFNHGLRHELLDRNPVQWVRQSAKRKKIPAVLEIEEVKSLLGALDIRERTMVLLDVVTGLRASELFGLKWTDINFNKNEISVTRSIVMQVVGSVQNRGVAETCSARSASRENAPYVAGSHEVQSRRRLGLCQSVQQRPKAVLVPVADEQSNSQGRARCWHHRRKSDGIRSATPAQRSCGRAARTSRLFRSCSGMRPAGSLWIPTRRPLPNRSEQRKTSRRFGTRAEAADSGSTPDSQTLKVVSYWTATFAEIQAGKEIGKPVKVVPFCAYEVSAKLIVSR